MDGTVLGQLMDAIAASDLGTQFIAVGSLAILISASIWGLYRGWKLFRNLL